MASFDDAINIVLKNEGGYVNNPFDPGGPTKYGISRRFLNSDYIDSELKKRIDINKDNFIDAEDIKSLKEEDASYIYKKYWWDKYKYENIDSQKIANKIFDMAINMGPINSHKIAQKSINDVNKEDKIKVDGIIGDKTLFSINRCEPIVLLDKIISYGKDYYNDLVKKNNNLSVFLKGWMNRINA